MAGFGEWERSVLGPDTGVQVVVRDEEGAIIGIIRLAEYCAQDEWSKMLKGWDRQYLWQGRE